MSDRVFLDTNVLVYLFDRDETAKREQAEGLLRDGLRPEDLVISTQVLQEFYVTVTRKFKSPLPEAEALAAVHRFSQLSVVSIDPPMVLRAIAFSQEHLLSLWDALIVQAALEGGCERLLTEDLHAGWQIGRLRVENPFTPGASAGPS